MLPADYLKRLSVDALERRFRRRLLRDSEFTLVAELDRRLVGYCGAGWSQAPGVRGEGEIYTLYLLNEAQGVGLGRALLTGAVRVLAARGAQSLLIWVLRDNEPARRFYERLGGRAQDVGGEWVGGGLVASVGYRWADLEGWLAEP